MMTASFSFVVQGPPVPAPRATQLIRADGKRSSAFTRRVRGVSYPKYKKHVALLATASLLRAGHVGGWPLGLQYSVASWFYVPHRLVGDIDNYVKTILDALNGVAWYDDRQVRHIEASICCVEPESRSEVRVEQVA